MRYELGLNLLEKCYHGFWGLTSLNGVHKKNNRVLVRDYGGCLPALWLIDGDFIPAAFRFA